MHHRLLLCLTIALCFVAQHAFCQSITGVVIDKATGRPADNVNIQNIYLKKYFTTDSSGTFAMEAEKGQLIEFSKIGYKTERLRVPMGIMPPYVKVTLEQAAIQLPEYIASQRGKDWKTDSLWYYEHYKKELNFPTMTVLEMIQHPFSAMSKTNQQIWAFQREYSMFEKEKYIDYVFNDKLIKNLTGLEGDSAYAYRTMFRPTYDQLRTMSEYDFYVFIQKTVGYYRSGYNPRRQPGRSSE